MALTGQIECAGYLMLREKYKWDDDALYRASCSGAPGWDVEGKQYCVMHAPLPDKAEDFDKALQERLAAPGENYSFRGVWFPAAVKFRKTFEKDAFFSWAVFNGPADFASARFTETVEFISTRFAGAANFRRAHFTGNAYFAGAEFGGAAWFSLTQFDLRVNFASAVFHEPVSFREARFEDEANFPAITFHGQADLTSAFFAKTVYFNGSVFAGEAVFEKTVFSGTVLFDQTAFKGDALADFTAARFEDCARFLGSTVDRNADIYFGDAVFEKGDRISFHSLQIRPRWFLNTDARKFNFEKVTFPVLEERRSTALELVRARKMLRRLRKRSSSHPVEGSAGVNELLAIACNRLADNAGDNDRYEESANLRYMAMEAKRLSRAGGWAIWTLHWWYWLSSGYGEKSGRALMVLLAIWLAFAGLYFLPPAHFYRGEAKAAPASQSQEQTDKTGHLETAAESLSYSFGVMSLQKPEPKPLGILTFLLVNLELAIGPLQTALLLLAIRRKFMR